MTWILILILQTAHGYAIDRIEAPWFAACEAMRVQYVQDRRVVAARCEVRRSGSDHSHVPSLAGGRLIQRRAL